MAAVPIGDHAVKIQVVANQSAALYQDSVQAGQIVQILPLRPVQKDQIIAARQTGDDLIRIALVHGHAAGKILLVKAAPGLPHSRFVDLDRIEPTVGRSCRQHDAARIADCGPDLQNFLRSDLTDGLNQDFLGLRPDHRDPRAHRLETELSQIFPFAFAHRVHLKSGRVHRAVNGSVE